MRDLVVTGLPHIAQAFKQSFGTINYTQYSGVSDGNPMVNGGPSDRTSAACGQRLWTRSGQAGTAGGPG